DPGQHQGVRLAARPGRVDALAAPDRRRTELLGRRHRRAGLGPADLGRQSAGQHGRPADGLPDLDGGHRLGRADRHRPGLGPAVDGHPEEEPTCGPAAMNATKTHGRHGEAAIEAKGLVKRFKTGRTYVEVLKEMDFDASHGDVTMVMGPSGSGKSTLIAALSGLLRPDAGTVAALDCENLWKLSPGRIDKFRLDHCGFIFQGFNLFPALTALDQVKVVLKYQGVPPAERHARARAALEEVGL